MTVCSHRCSTQGPCGFTKIFQCKCDILRIWNCDILEKVQICFMLGIIHRLFPTRGRGAEALPPFSPLDYSSSWYVLYQPAVATSCGLWKNWSSRYHYSHAMDIESIFLVYRLLRQQSNDHTFHQARKFHVLGLGVSPKNIIITLNENQ